MLDKLRHGLAGKRKSFPSYAPTLGVAILFAVGLLFLMYKIAPPWLNYAHLCESSDPSPGLFWIKAMILSVVFMGAIRKLLAHRTPEKTQRFFSFYSS